MMRGLRLVVAGVLALPVIAVAAVLLFWLGRSDARQEPIEYEYDPDDPGLDVDEDERTS